MEPNHNSEYSPESELPQLEEVIGPVDNHEQIAATPETRGQQPATASAGIAGQAAVTPPDVLASDDASSSAVPGSSYSTTALIADDADLIEKEWVLKAKAIVMRTKDDPREQNIQMNDVKADYLKKRYNKDLKVTES